MTTAKQFTHNPELELWHPPVAFAFLGLLFNHINKDSASVSLWFFGLRPLKQKNYIHERCVVEEENVIRE